MPYNLYNKAGIMVPPALKGFLFGSRTIITATGATNYSAPRYAKALLFQLQAGGGGGKNCANSSAGQIVLGGGGAAGTYVEHITLALPGVWVVSVGTGGLGSSGTGGASTTLTAPIFNNQSTTVASATGGNAGGTLATGTSQIYVVGSASAAGPITTAGIVLQGQPSKAFFRNSGTLARSGKGADSFFGAGGRAVIAQGAGNAGGIGAGGSGGMSVNAGGAANGGNGGDGICVIWEYY